MFSSALLVGITGGVDSKGGSTARRDYLGVYPDKNPSHRGGLIKPARRTFEYHSLEDDYSEYRIQALCFLALGATPKK